MTAQDRNFKQLTEGEATDILRTYHSPYRDWWEDGFFAAKAGELRPQDHQLANAILKTNSETPIDAARNYADEWLEGYDSFKPRTSTLTFTLRSVRTDSVLYWQSRAKTFLKVYIDVERPIDDGDFRADFEWRRTHATPVPPKDIKRYIAERYGFDADDLRVRYDRNCGCSMCPCSPGYRVLASDSQTAERFAKTIQAVEGLKDYGLTDLWLKVDAIEV